MSKKLIIKNGECSYIENNEVFEIDKETKIMEKKQLLNKYKEDVEQVELFGMDRADYLQKKQLCRQLIIELRVLEKTD